MRHPLDRLLCAKDGTDRVDRENALHPLELEILRPGLLCDDRGVVHQHIDPAKLPIDLGEELSDLPPDPRCRHARPEPGARSLPHRLPPHRPQTLLEAKLIATS